MNNTEINNPTHSTAADVNRMDELIERGRRLHSLAVAGAVVKILGCIKPNLVKPGHGITRPGILEKA